MSTLAVVDYGMGNLHSLTHALARVSAEVRVEVTYDPERIARADRLILPGVGGVRHCMDELARLELAEVVQQMAGEVPILGICLGMQVMLEYSEENNGVDALGIFPGKVRRFADPPLDQDPARMRRKVPHMGWNRVSQHHSDHPMWRNVPDNSWFYFVHSYFACPLRDENILGTTEYGERFASVLLRKGVVAAQFHPEKSQGPGMQFLANFVTWDGDF